MAKLRINGDSSGYVDLEAPNAASSSTLDLDQVPQKNAANTFTTHQVIRTDTASGGYTAYPSLTLRNDNVNGYSVLHFNRGATTQSARIEVDNNNGSPTIGMYATSGGNGIKVDHNGYVTKPQQPGFQFWNNGSDFAISAGGKVTCFYAGDHNVGSHFNASNQRFTAPVSGYYLFGGHLRIGAPGKIRVARFQIYLNGSRLRDLMSVGGTNDYDGSSGYDHPGASGTAVQYLTAGDYVEMYVDAELSSSNTVYIQGGSNSNRKSYWFGHLLG